MTTHFFSIRALACGAGLLLAAYGVAAVEAPAPHAGHAAGGHRPSIGTGAEFSPSGALWIANIEGDGHLAVRISNDQGAHFSVPRQLDTQGDVIAADGESRPTIAFGPNGVVLIAYARPLAKPYTGEIRLLRSTDGGFHFAAPVVVHDDRQEITHRFQNLAFDHHGDLYVVWIDKRDAELARAGGGRDAYRGAAIYGKRSTDGGRTFGPDLRLGDHSCECCRIALAESPTEGLVALWRHVFEGNVRDHALLALSELGQGSEPRRATADGWVLAACPHHGPALVAAEDGGYHAVWFGLDGDRPAARYGRLAADGTPRGTVRSLPDAGAEHADVAAAGAMVVISWRSYDNGRTHLRAWVSNDAGATFALREVDAASGDTDQPHLLRNGSALYVVWNTEGGVRAHRLDR